MADLGGKCPTGNETAIRGIELCAFRIVFAPLREIISRLVFVSRKGAKSTREAQRKAFGIGKSRVKLGFYDGNIRGQLGRPPTTNPPAHRIDQDDHRRRHDEHRERSVDVTLCRRCRGLRLRPEDIAN